MISVCVSFNHMISSALCMVCRDNFDSVGDQFELKMRFNCKRECDMQYCQSCTGHSLCTSIAFRGMSC